MSELTSGLVDRLRDAFEAADYTVEGVAARLGARANAALARNETTLAYRQTAQESDLDTLIRLFLLQRPVLRSLLDKATGGLLPDLVALGILSVDGAEVSAALDVRPYAEDDRSWWVIADLTPGLDGRRATMRPDYVLGIAPASLSLVKLTVPLKVESALDLGTGCGIQALHLADRANHLVATDVNPRALQLTRWTAALNRIELDVRDGSLYEPVAGQRFDLIVSNPPYVIAPPSDGKLTYRETGFAGDSVVEQLVRQAPQHLTEGGWCQLLANWTCVRGEDWRERIAGWTGDRSSWVVQREQLDPAEYVELWLRDAGLHGRPEYTRRYDEWLVWLDQQRVEAIGMGWITVRNVAGSTLAEEWPYEIEQPIGPHVLQRFQRQQELPEDLTGLYLKLADDVVQETAGPPGADDPATIVLRRQRGMRRAEQVDTVLAGFVGACDGDLRVGQILDALATLLDRDDLHADYLPEIRRLLVEGFLEV
ncbi:methyltransferase small [Kribbella flavida DSM 17836]|uniref:Methyltransferase small n=1 Tax=Kribbella flavida (strain DSM 17836 / JCM 10339 / NBRC 14399) TaxID=479435 RepID=D2PW41_KRIFD|nr:class I SAM-dependent methyltransferase [Kribbella flavida]ADB29698.1 methyltransferase small [Kribbella flavida DSM 17836]